MNGATQHIEAGNVAATCLNVALTARQFHPSIRSAAATPPLSRHPDGDKHVYW